MKTLISAGALLLAIACSSGDPESSTATGGTGGTAGVGGTSGSGSGAECAELAAECFANQSVCVASASGAVCEPCPIGEYPALDGCVAIQGDVVSHEFADFTVGPGEEVLGLCQSWTLDNAEEIWVNAVELEQDEESHHSNWLFVPDNEFDGPDGVWPCSERGYSQLQAALLGGVLYAQSTQATKEVQKFPDGVAVRIPPYSRIIGDVHLLNATDETHTGSVTLHVYGIPRSEVNVKLAPFHLTYDTLAIPPQSTSRFYGECDIEQYSQSVLGRPWDAEVYFILPHTHALGSRFFLEVLGGPHDGESIIDVHGFNGEARGRYYTPPIDMTGATGFRFGCEFENSRDEVVEWGFGDQEMCENLGFIASDMAFESRVSTVESAGADGDVQVFTGPCSSIAFQYDHEKAGGPAR